MGTWKRLFLLFLVVLLRVGASFGQTQLFGVVVNTERKPIEGASVQLTTRTNKTIAFSFTDERGRFTLVLKEMRDSICNLNVRHISYQGKILTVEAGTKDIQISLLPKLTTLKEVIVKAPPLYQKGDTITYSLKAFTSDADLTLRDALKKLPGLDIAENGKIKYQGKEISNFYIEGLDLLGGKYNIATNNIPSSYVSSVQVLNNHSDAKIDKGTLSDNVALNVRLTKQAKIRPVGSYNIIGGGGDDAIYQASGSAMVFKPNFQLIGALKAGNITEFSTDNSLDNISKEEVQSLASIVVLERMGASPPIKRERYINPEDYFISLGSISKLSETTTLSANLGYGLSKTRYDYNYNLDFVNGISQSIIIQQQTSPMESKHTPFLSLDYKNNADKRYFQNKFSIKYNHLSSKVLDLSLLSKSRAGLGGRYQDINLSDVLSLRWRRGNTQWGVLGLVRYLSTPKSHIEVFKNNEDRIHQLADSRQFLSRISLYSSYTFKGNRISFPISIQYQKDNLLTQLTYSSAEERFVNDLWGQNLLLSCTPEYEYTHPLRKYVFRLKLSLLNEYIDYQNTGTNPLQQKKSSFRLNPSIYLNYKLNAKSDFRVTATYSETEGNLLDLLTSSIQTNTRVARSNSGILTQNQTLQVSADYGFRLPIEMWFLNVGGTYTYQNRNLISAQIVSSDLLNNITTPHNNVVNMLNIFGALTKQIQGLRTKITLSGAYSHSEQSMVQNDVGYRYKGGSLTLSSSIVSKPFNFLDLNYLYLFNKAFNRVMGKGQHLSTHTQNVRIDIKPNPKWSFKLSSEINTKEISPSNWANMCLFDIGATYIHRKLRYSIELNNLFNNRSYSYSIFNGVNTYSYYYSLRGRELLLSITLTM